MSINREELTSHVSLQGVWQLLSLQAQNDTLFNKMVGIEIKKINFNGHWMSSAYKIDNNEVVFVAGGSYEYKEGFLYEKIEYHMKNLESIGDINIFKVKIISGDSIYISGILKEGTADEYKIEEYWRKISMEE